MSEVPNRGKGSENFQNVDESFVAQLQAKAKSFISNITGGTWFGPNQPIAPAAPETQGRTWDYMAGYNLIIKPRQTEQIGFADLRALAENLDILRLVIETRKDQVMAQSWSIMSVNEEDAGKFDDDIKSVKDFLQFPARDDRGVPVLDFERWLRKLLDDVFVIDALSIEPRKNKGGKLFSLDPIDGATIVARIDAFGRTPTPPDVAYQQVLKGLPANNLTADQLIYYPRNLRTNKVYGYSPVEQIIMIINMALRRNLHVLNYYTEGTLPDMIVEAPANWTTNEIEEFDKYFTGIMEGNLAQRRKARFMPGGIKVTEVKQEVLKDQFDEWLARIVCYAFSVSPQPLMAMMNKATAETAVQEAKDEGLIPLLKYIKNLMDMIIVKHMGMPHLRFEWNLDVAEDITKQAQAHKIYADLGAMSVNEIRENLGMDAIEGGDAHLVLTSSGLVPIEQASQGTQQPVIDTTAEDATITEPTPEAEKMIKLLKDVTELAKQKKKSYHLISQKASSPQSGHTH